MDIRYSLKRKSKLALAFYLAVVVTLIGTVSYLVVEPPTRQQLEANLDLRTELISAHIQAPVNHSLGILQSIVSIGSSDVKAESKAHHLHNLFALTDGVAVSGGLWPAPFSQDPEVAYASLFFNRTEDGTIERVYSWDDPGSGGYDHADWYQSVINAPIGEVSWSRVYVDPYTQVKMITASSPYYINNIFSGVATVDLSLEGLINFIRLHADEYDLGIFLTDAYGEIILEHQFSHLDGEYIGQNTFGHFKWRVDVVNARRIVDEQVIDVVAKVEAGIIPIMLVCVMLGYFLISRYLIDPIVLIAQKVADSKEGGIIDINYHSNDEVRQLIDTFNQKTVYLEAEKKKALASTQAKSAFLATLSHEIRTPMNGVLGTAQILLKTPLDESQRKHLRALYESGEHMMTLLNEILDFSKIEQGRVELDNQPFPFEAIIGSIHSTYFSLCAEKGLEFKVLSEVPKHRWYRADKARLRQILFNLLNNAVKFTSVGQVTVNVREKYIDNNNFLCIAVTDTGIGIPQRAQEKIFKPFVQAESSTTRRYGGTGLGLSIVKQLCESMGGEVRVVSTPGEGSCFEVLVRVEHSETQTPVATARSKQVYTGLRALIVEDNRTNAAILNALLANKGFTCDCSINGEQAIQAVISGEYDLIFMDHHMPVMDGVEATEVIRTLGTKWSRILIFGCTADLFQESRLHMKHAGVDHIIAKPIDDIELDEALSLYSDTLYQYKPDLKNQDLEKRLHA
ncbi:hybrid sensor histidine kinase/response regulator [Vibrio nereis]|uniref:histidine kinase n=1 Tax=Vibrio nereis TaxID=693 RepID=A0A0M0HTU7_VIBNE|nr:hybrid sensor histidine kinase/response regulator [Vibrio nereis]KOO05327.1 histidine kinase [Vibrio nereis]